MADEFPVNDVLCQAMDYLSKLGSNLHTRSGTLMDKRKDKLNNSIAVKKTAGKVLLICELSKKALANVEAGVRKILDRIDVSQSASGIAGKSNSKTDRKFNKPKYHYIDYKSRKLKIKTKISLKHYKSVKVLARKMTLSMIDKYPVYHDCKLYRLRKNEHQNPNKEQLESVDCIALNDKYPSNSNENTRRNSESHRRIYSESDDSDKEKKIQPNDNNKKASDVEQEAENDLSCSLEPNPKRRKTNLDNDLMNNVVFDTENLTQISNEDEVKSDMEKNIGNDSVKKPFIKCVSLTKLLKPDIIKDLPKVETLINKKKEFDVNKKNKALQISKRHNDEFWASKRNEVSAFKSKEFTINIMRLPEITKEFLSSNNIKEVVKEGETICDITENKTKSFPDHEISHNTNKAIETAKDNESKDEHLITVANKVKNSLLYESDSDRDIDTISKSKKKALETTVNRIEKIKNALLDSDSDQDADSAEKKEHTQSNGNEDQMNENVSATSKLTNNEAINNLQSKSDSETPLSQRKRAAASEKKSDSDDKIEQTKKICDSNDEDELKKNTDNVNNITEALLQTPEKQRNAKKSLLNDSSNDESETPLSQRKGPTPSEKKSDSVDKIEQTNKICDSISKNENITANKKVNDEDELKKNSDNGNNITEPLLQTPEKQRNAKKSLLNDSSNDESGTPVSQIKPSATPQSKKKRIRESVQAKRALLRCSSGSETEDEQLRTTLNDIKKTLLEGLSDDENKVKPNNMQGSSKDSDSSSEDIPVTVKKKTKKKKTRRHVISSDSEKEKKNSSSDDKKSSSSDDKKSSSSSYKMVRSKSKPGSSLSSDAQDLKDKDIDGLTNLKTLSASRRRNSDDASDDETESSNSNAKTKMSAKPTAMIGDDILKAESSSDAASNDEGALDDDDEELPSVTIPGFNGGLQALVREDLLDSDSSVSNKEEKLDESDEGQLSSKRRKANAIASSDSEAGTTRKNKKNRDDDVRISDFDDSDDSDVTKRTKRKKKGSDSDASGDSSDTAKQKKRRRIKTIDDSDGSGSDSDIEGKNKHGRKNIRKVMGKNQLEEATKKAAREEKERVARIAERQKMYNNLQFDESGKPDEVVLDRVVLDFDPETKEPLIAVDRGLVKKLKPHQANGIKFMWDACFESVKRIKKAKGSGCILAHCMGLGKTLQVVALTHTLLAHGSLTKVERVLVVCPLSTVLNWVNEFKMWLKYAEKEKDIDVYELSRFKQNNERAFQLSEWYKHGGVCVLGYEMFRNLSADNNKKFKKKLLKNFQEALVEPGPDMVVCDEGHLLKNEKTSLSQSMNKVRTLRRIVLTGTPLQNNLKEYYCMVQFVKPNLLGKYNEYLNRFVNPITNGQYTDSTDHDIKIMKRRSHVLHKMLDGAVQRRDYGVLAPFLPPKHEYVLFITLTDVQVKLYQHYLDNYSRRPLPGKSSGFLFPDFQSLQRIWTHPLVLKYNSDRYEIMQQKKRDKEEEEDDSEGSLVDFIDDDSTPAESSSDDSSNEFSDMSDDSRKKSKKKKSSKKSKGKDKDKEAGSSRRRATRANPIDVDLEEDKDDDVLEVRNENPTEWWIKMVEEEELEDLRNSHKLVLLFDILRQCEAIGDKLLVFSQSLYSLDLIEHFLGKVDEATQDARVDEKLGNHVGSWSQGVDYFRLDGSTSCENRSIWCKSFNREDNPRARLFLISTRAGGLGINLVAANRVVIFDVSWNPSHDVQSIFRVYRFGQKKPCYVYRFLAMGTMEEKIYERQVTKQAISKRVIDEQQIDRHYAENDLAELYKFEAVPPSPRPLPPLPKDRLFAEMLREHDKQIYKYHEHDSLLENKEEETLSEEERKAAWEDFENEKTRPPPAPFPSPWQMNGMMPNMLAQQQQQLAYAALATVLRKDMPNLNDNQIRDMLPMIYNANPALMQKMSEMLKYSQHMNMGPGMMGQSGMNPASSALGMGSSSSLQYEPPWQRQQQQQQQLRLQQLMAQQQNMGAAAKFYAGGLGSRDPVAMALQQQRAREIMVGGAASRPRGRPPLQPRAPPTHGDVVNLDSD